MTNAGCGIYLSETDLKDLEAAARILQSPFGYGDLNGWRAAVNKAVIRLIRADLALFFIDPAAVAYSEGQALVWSDELSPTQMVDFIRHGLHDAGSDRALAFGLAAVCTRELVADDWDGYFADPGVNNFYLPNDIHDSIAMMSWNSLGVKQASVEIHASAFGAALFDSDGLVRMRLLLPAFQGSIAVVQAVSGAGRGLSAVLERLGQPLALVNARGTLMHRTAVLNELIEADPAGATLGAMIEALAKAHASQFEARGFGRQHRAGGTAITSSQSVLRELVTANGRYRVFIVEAPDSLTDGRLGFLLHVERMFEAALSVAELQSRFGLSLRELHVARLLAAGSTNGAVAAALAISPHTARRHTESVLRKLNVSSRASVGSVLRGEHQMDPHERLAALVQM